MIMKFLQGIDDNQFWICMWTLIGAVIIILSFVVTAYFIHNEQLQTKLVQEGHDPIAVRCMFASSTEYACTIYISQSANQHKESNNVAIQHRNSETD